MITLWRGNSFTEIHGAPDELLIALTRHLAVPLPDGGYVKRGHKYHHTFKAHDESGAPTYWATLVHHNRVPAGLTPHVMTILDHYKHPYALRDKRVKPEDALPLWAVSGNWRPYQDIVHKRILEHGSGVIVAPPRCLDGDSIVRINRAGKTFKIKLRDLVHRFNGGVLPSGKELRWRPEIETKIQARDADGFVRLFSIAKAWVSGKKQVLRLETTSGKVVRASSDHLVLTARGWKRMGDIELSDQVYEDSMRSRKPQRAKSTYAFRSNLFAHPYAGRRGRNKDKGSYCVQTHRLVVESYINGLTLDEFILRIRKQELEGLTFLNPREVHVHHIDGDRRNNTIENLEQTSPTDHRRHHGKDGGWKNVTRRTLPVGIKSIEVDGYAETFDIHVPGAENFIANGVVVHNSGKTFMMARAIDALNHKTLVVAPSLAIVQQTFEVFRGVFGEGLVSRVDGEATPAERDLSKKIVIATTASAIRLPQEFFDACGILAIDEFHHGAAESYHKLNALAGNIYYRLCFTGTHFRTDDADRLAMEAICSTVLADIPVNYLVQNRWLAAPRFVMVRPDAPWITANSYPEAYEKGIVKCDKRNELVAKIASTLGNANGIPTIVLVKRRPHAKLLGQMIADSAVVMGGEDALTNQKIRDFRRGHLAVLIGTTVIGEGVDLPAAGAVVYASGGGASVQQIQSYYRSLTAHENKSVGLVYDFKDQHHMTLSRHSEERLLLGEKCLDTTTVRLW